MTLNDLIHRSTTFWRHQAQEGGAVTQTRPPGVEAILSISGMLGVRHWLENGHLNAIHPARASPAAGRAPCRWRSTRPGSAPSIR
jgi:hypothetical protein